MGCLRFTSTTAPLPKVLGDEYRPLGCEGEEAGEEGVEEDFCNNLLAGSASSLSQ